MAYRLRTAEQIVACFRGRIIPQSERMCVGSYEQLHLASVFIRHTVVQRIGGYYTANATL